MPFITYLDGGGPTELHTQEHNHLFIVTEGEARSIFMPRIQEPQTDSRMWSLLRGMQEIAFLFNSDRAACIHYIKKHGEEAFAKTMADKKQMTIKKRK